MKIVLLIALIPALVLPSPAAQVPEKCKPLKYRVWQLQDYDLDHVKRLIGMAADAEVNRIQLSHSIVMDSGKILNKPQLASDINSITKWAHAKRIKVDVWTHELNGVPKDLMTSGKANLDDPKLWQWMRDKYERVFKLCPDIDGLVLTMQESEMPIYHTESVSGLMPMDERVTKLVDNVAAVCKEFHKQLFVRTFSYEPAELKYICDGLKQSKAEIIVMTKCQPHDWQPFYPDNPAIGDVGEHPQVIEFDLGYEFLGLSRIPYIDLDYLAKRLSYDISKGAAGAVLRVERLDWWAVDTPNWANADIFTRMLSNPCLDQKAEFRKWLEARYGKEAAPHLERAFGDTFDVVNKSYFALGNWFTNHSILPSYDYATSSLENRATAKWDPSKETVKQRLTKPTFQTLRDVEFDKRIAVQLVREALDDVESAKPYLKDADYQELRELFDRELAMADVWQSYTNLFMEIRSLETAPTFTMRSRIRGLTIELEQKRKKYEQQLIAMASHRGNPKNDANLRAIDGMIAKAQSMTKPAGAK